MRLAFLHSGHMGECDESDEPVNTIKAAFGSGGTHRVGPTDLAGSRQPAPGGRGALVHSGPTEPTGEWIGT